MIPQVHIIAWRGFAPWSSDAQVEQDLVLSRALVEIFADPFLQDRLAFRGGTALHKLYLTPAARYSDDIDLVQVHVGPIGPVLNAIRAKLDPWLGTPKWEHAKANAKLYYKFDSEMPPVVPLRLKVEINSREHFSAMGYAHHHFTLDNPWSPGAARVMTYTLEELLGTKFKALYQRRKGRDLFDLDYALKRLPQLDTAKVIDCSKKYLAHDRLKISRAQCEANMEGKMRSSVFIVDIRPLLRHNLSFDMLAAYKHVHDKLISKLPGEPWKGIKKK